jgi:hypothetical protein
MSDPVRTPFYVCNERTRWDQPTLSWDGFSTTDPEAAFAHVMQTHHTMLFRQEDRRTFYGRDRRAGDRRLSFGRRSTDVPS